LVGPGSRAKLCPQPLGPGSAAARSLTTSLKLERGTDASWLPLHLLSQGLRAELRPNPNP